MTDNNQLEFRSNDVQEILTNIPHWIVRWGNLVILIILVGILSLTFIIKYPEIVSGEIIVTTHIPPQKIIARTSGKLQKILVPNHASVQIDEPLAIIQNSASYENLFTLKSVIDSIKVREADFTFPIDLISGMRLGEVESAYVIFEKDFITYELNKNLKPYSAEGIAQNSETIELKERLSILIMQKETGEQELLLKKKDLNRHKLLYEKGFISAQEWENKSMSYLQAEKIHRTINSSISEIKSSITQLTKSKKLTVLNKGRDNINSFRNMVQSLNQLKKALSDWELAYVLRSSISGKISYLQVWDENQTILVEENVFNIIPDDKSHYIGKVKAKSLNSGKIKLGQTVNVRLFNFPDNEYGLIKGRIDLISMTPDREGNILIDVTFPKGLETTRQKKIVFQYEMMGQADIITEDYSLIDRLFNQLISSTSR